MPVVISKKKFIIVWLFGWISGFTIMLSGYTLNYWLSFEKIDIRTIGLFSLISIPYAINYTWAPVFDAKKIPLLSAVFGHRLSWLVLIQVFLSMAVYLMSTFEPNSELVPIAISGFLISFFASAQDSILGALRTELVEKRSQGAISGWYVFGYRIGMLVSTSGAIFISQYIKWNLIYELFSLVIFSFPIILILFSKELSALNIRDEFHSIHENTEHRSYFEKACNLISQILKPVGNKKYILLVIVFLVFYRLPDNFIMMMINPFLHHIGYNSFEISTAGKLFGAISAILGGLIASHIMKKKNIFDSLLIFGSIHATCHILYIAQEFYGKDITILFIITGFEGVTGGMTMAAYIAFIASLCDGKFRATQYSFFSSMMGLSRSIFPTISGYIVSYIGWSMFFIFTILCTVPALILILYLEKYQKLKNQNNSDD